MADDWGYDEVNLNVGCPSDRVQSGRFGACLMATPGLVADGVAAMREAAPLPVTVKHRIGIDELDSYEHLARFVETVAAAGCATFIVHARKAWLHGLSPRENREVPPLHYERVRQLKADFPALEIVVNGGIRSLADAQAHMDYADGVMVGRAAYHDPYLLAAVDRILFGDLRPVPTRHAVAEAFIPYVQQRLARGARLQTLTRHVLGLFQGRPGARTWRRTLTERAVRPGAGIEVVWEALQRVPREDAGHVDRPA
jgi:tRNA-dihydrouridine synthase A